MPRLSTQNNDVASLVRATAAADAPLTKSIICALTGLRWFEWCLSLVVSIGIASVVNADAIRLKKNPYFDIHEGHIRYTSQLGVETVNDADVSTFEYAGGLFGRDRVHVFFGEKIVEGADPKTFTVIDSQTGKDDKSIFRAYSRCEECDLNTFRKASKGWYVDRNAAYAALGNGWRRISGVNSSSFKVLNSWFAKDDSRVYSGANPIPSADAQSFKLESCGICEVCGEDKNRCYRYEQAVPCNCQTYPPFIRGMTEIRQDSAILDLSQMFALLEPRLPAAGGRFFVQPGEHRLRLQCLWNSQTLEITTDFRPRELYRYHISRPRVCDAVLDRPGLIQGRREQPEIRVLSPTRQNYDYEIESPSGPLTLSVLCRDVTRSHVTEQRSEVALNVEPGKIYQLEHIPPFVEGRCSVSAKPVSGE